MRLFKFKKKAGKGFTLIEMLLSTVMVAIIGAALYVMLSNGIKVWVLINQNSPLTDMQLFFERVHRDIVNCFYYKNMSFSGTEKEVSFPSLMSNYVQDERYSYSLGKIRYSYNSSNQSVEIQQSDYSELYTRQTPVPRVILEGVEDMTFSYYFYDGKKESFFWSPIWPPDGMDNLKSEFPLAFRMTISVKEGKRSEQWIKTINVPIGGKGY